MITVNRQSNAPIIPFYVGSGGVKKGQLCKVDTSTAVPTAEGVSTAIIIGVAVDAYDAGEIGYFWPLSNDTMEIDIYQGGSTDTFAASDVGKAFDLYVDGSTGEMFVDANDTTGAMLVVQSYDNTAQKAICKIINSLLYLA